METHQQLIEEYNTCEKRITRVKGFTIILEILVIGITVWMKTIQKTASLNLHIIATLGVGILLSWHFSGFRQRRANDRNRTRIVLEGLKIERQNFMPPESFFQKYLKEFNIFSEMVGLAIFDLIFIYFFSISFTQLLQKINPELVTKLMPSTPFRSLIITACLGWAYFLPLRPLVHVKRENRGEA